jgi:crotonobetainyl-CoA:carnitine CoA-transferase CaiB-like acyl-CoA transferase
MFHQLKVIELASVLAGPSVGQFLAELGAEVIKIENPKTKGDVTRSWKLSAESSESDISAYFTAVNWGKKSVCLDISQGDQLQVLYELIESADIVIASYKPGDAELLKVDYETLRAIQPSLIYGHITGYGNASSRLGYDAIIQAESGFMYLNGEKEGGPLKMPVALMDILAGHQLKEAILVALIAKLTTGKGAYVEVALLDAAVASLANQACNYLVAGVNPERIGAAHPNIVPYGTIFKTQDHFDIVLAVGNDKQFKNLCACIALTDLCDDERFKSNAARVTYRSALMEVLSAQIIQFKRDSLLALLEAHQVPAGVINTVKEVLDSPEMAHLYFGNSTLKGLKTFIAKGVGETIDLCTPPHLGADTASLLNKK